MSNFDQFQSDDVVARIVRIGYTQGELQEDFEDFEDGFNAPRHVYWNFIVLYNDSLEENNWLIFDIDNSSYIVGDGYVDVAEKIALICNKTTEDKFGREFVSQAFESVVVGALDEPDGFDCIDDVLGNIGGSLDEDSGIKIPEECVNSLFSMTVDLDSDISFKGNVILLDGESIDLDKDYSSETKLVYFTEDVMNYQ